MKPAAYSFDAQGRFVVEQYNDGAPFASFLPGIAGPEGVPAWAFYVNRGQALASFGVRNKDGAMLEFFPADKAYQLTPSRGFRTFLKVRANGQILVHEPFQRGAGEGVQQRLYIAAHEVGVEEIHPGLGLSIRAEMSILPDSPLPALLRKVTVQNLASHAQQVHIVDGLPQVLPYGLNQWCVKFMSRTHEAFMLAEGVAEKSLYLRLRVMPTDSPQVERIEAGNFFVGFLDGQRTAAIVDPETVFGWADDFSSPESFFAGDMDLSQQVLGNKTPCAMQTLSLALSAGETRVFYGLYGQASSWQALQDFLGAGKDAAWFEAKRERAREVVQGLTRRAFSATARPVFDAYAEQCYLDNGLRGGFSMPVPGAAGRVYLYGRKHGDLERDYNDFLLQDSPYSEGNGDFRDTLQNRRIDVFFDPELGAKNIHYFFSLIQPDGYNPQVLRGTRFVVDAQALPERLAQIPGLLKLIAQPFKYGQLWRLIKVETDQPVALIQAVLQHAEEIEDADFDRGYWSDHWSYLLDLLESYAALFPEKLASLFAERCYAFFDPTHCVLARSAKTVVTPEGVRQLGAVAARKDKIALIAERKAAPYRVRAEHGKGEVVTTTLLGKIVTLIANKLASLDPEGVGVDMEADRPGWCDALNGLPGLFGSSVNETIELKRLADFTQLVLAQTDGECPVPMELADFVAKLETLLAQSPSSKTFWQTSQQAKEDYRAAVFMGFDGAEVRLPYGRLRDFLKAVSSHLDTAIAKARSGHGICTYFAYEAEAYQETGEGVEVERFRQRPLPWFLEGFVHALRIANPEQARMLYHAVCESELYDRKLGMFRVNVPLGEDPLEFGRIGVFNYGWLENGSVFLHMHYKFVLEMARRGLVKEFYEQIDRLLVPFRPVDEYRRSPLENSSFLVSSGFAVDPRQHGRGCVARLSGATVEFLHLWTHLFLGVTPFVVENGALCFRPQPSLAGFLFSSAEQRAKPFGEEEILPANSAVCAFLGATLLVYHNPARLDSFGPDAATPCRYQLFSRDGREISIEGPRLESSEAEALRSGQYRRVDVWLGR